MSEYYGPMGKKPSSPDTGAGTEKSLRAHALRTGKIHVARASASEIRQSVGVRPSEARIAAKALRAVTGKIKVKTTTSKALKPS